MNTEYTFEQRRIGIDIKDEFDKKCIESDNVIANAAFAVGSFLMDKRVLDGFIPEDPKYVVKMTDEVKRLIGSGEFRIDSNKEGKCFAQLRNNNTGAFGQKLEIGPELLAAGVDPISLAMAVQMKGIERQLAKICDTLDDINSKVSSVMQGQVNDRIGLFYSGFNLYMEAEMISDPSFKMLVQAQALKALTDSCEQMNQSIQSDIAYLIQGKYKKQKNQTAEIDWRIKNINSSFEVIHNSFALRSTIYFKNNEYDAMMETVRQYGTFLSKVIVPNSGALTEFDKHDRSLVDTKWGQRAKALEEIKIQQLDYKREAELVCEG